MGQKRSKRFISQQGLPELGEVSIQMFRVSWTTPIGGSMSVGGRAGKTCQSSKLEIIETARLRGWPSPQPKTKSAFTPPRKAKVSVSVNGCCGQLGVAGLHRFPLLELWHLFAPLQACGPARSNPCHRSSNVGTFSWRSLMARA